MREPYLPPQDGERLPLAYQHDAKPAYRPRWPAYALAVLGWAIVGVAGGLIAVALSYGLQDLLAALRGL